MVHYQIATVVGSDEEDKMGIVLDEVSILRILGKYLSEQKKHKLLSWYLSTRTDRYLIMFSNGTVSLFKPDDVEVFWRDSEVA